jgi:pSer/pThr/pTyr-binding forkhead associated (FHA) protein
MRLIVEERGRVVTYDLDEHEVTLGRDLDCTVPLRDPAAAPSHIRIFSRDGETFAETVKGAGPAHYNGKRLARARLWPGDQLRVGDAQVWFEARLDSADDDDDAPPVQDTRTTLVATRTPALRAPETDLPDMQEPPRAPAGPPPGGAAIPPDDDDDELRELLGGDGDEEALKPRTPSGRLRHATGREAAAATRDARFALEIVEGPLKGKRALFSKLPVRIGRSKKNHLPIPDPEISGNHCEIAERAGGGAVIIDLGSTNGTKVNHKRVSRAAIADGARLELGGNVLVFRDLRTKTPGAGAPTTTGRRSSKARRRVPPPGREIVAPAALSGEPPQNDGDPESHDPHSLEAATAGLARHMAQEVAETGEHAAVGGRLGPRFALGALVAALVAAAGLFVWTTLPGEAARADADPAPSGAVANWSFEEPAAGATVPGWRAVPGAEGELALRAERAGDPFRAAGGHAALELVASGSGPAMAEAREAMACGGREVEVRAMVRAPRPGEAPPALGVAWESSVDPDLRLHALAPVAALPGAWTAARVVLVPPPGCDRARVVLLATDEATWDRVVLVERGLPEPRRRAVEGAGVAVRVDYGGALAVDRAGLPVVDRMSGVLVPAGATGIGPAAAALTAEARPLPDGEGGWWLDGRVLAPGDGQAGPARMVSYGASIAGGDGAVTARWALDGAVAGARLGVEIFLSRGALLDDLERVEERAAEGGAPARVRELVLGTGAAALSIACAPAVEVREHRAGGAAVLTLLAPAGAADLELAFGGSSSRARQGLDALRVRAEGLEREGRLEEARRVWIDLRREAWQPEQRRVAGQRADALAARAELALEEVEALERDALEVGQSALLDGADERCRFISGAYPGTDWARRAGTARARLDAAREQLRRARRQAAAAALFARARAHLEAQRFRMGRALLEELVSAYADIEDVAEDARRDLAFATRTIEEGER